MKIEHKLIITKNQPGNNHYNKMIYEKYYKNIFSCVSEMIYHYLHSDINKQMFCYCGNKNKFKGLNKGYTKYCSNKCKNNNIVHNKLCTNKKINNIDKNGLNSYQRQILKSKQTKKEKYNNENYNNIDNNGLNSYERSVIKHKENYLKKYNVDSYFKTQQFKDKFKSKIFKEKFLYKQYETKKKNNSFNKSIQEEQVYNYLLQKFNKDDIERQYKSNLYPFASDFYIKSIDLYIEYHGTWTHGNKPFKHSIEDLQKLEELKNKNSKYYNTAIYVWSNLDVKKLNTFKNNKLHYKIFYKIEQFLNWYNKI